MNRKLALSAIPLVLLAAVILVFSQGAEVLAQLGLTAGEARQASVEALATGSVFHEAAFAAFKAMPPAARASIVKAGLSWAKAYTAGPDFKADYARYREAQKPDPGEAVPTVEDFLKKQRQEMETQAAEMRKAAAGMDAATRKTMEDAIKQMMAQIEAMEKDPEQKAQIKAMLEGQKAEAEARREEALAEWNKRTPADPKTLIRDRIREFLETSADVDFEAKLVKKGLLFFENEDYEAKPASWKLCFRAGREAVAAARAFAESWLAELEK